MTSFTYDHWAVVSAFFQVFLLAINYWISSNGISRAQLPVWFSVFFFFFFWRYSWLRTLKLTHQMNVTHSRKSYLKYISFICILNQLLPVFHITQTKGLFWLQNLIYLHFPWQELFFSFSSSWNLESQGCARANR